MLCKKCYTSLRSGDGSVLHNAGHTFEFPEQGHGEGEVQSEALASALQDKMAFTRQGRDKSDVHQCQTRPSIQVKETYNRGTVYRQLGALLVLSLFGGRPY